MVSSPSKRQCLELLAASSHINRDRWKPISFGNRLTSSSDLEPAILDAFASICTANRGEVYALSAEIHSDQILLRVAGNNGVPIAVKKHLEQVWKLLQDYNRTPKEDASQKPGILNSMRISKETALCPQIYQFSINKLQHRVMTHGEETAKSFKQWSSQDIRRCAQLDRACRGLETINKIFGTQSVFLAEYSRTIELIFQGIYQQVKPALDGISDPAVLAAPPWRGLNKILSLHKDTKTLKRLTRSPIRERYLMKQLRVIRMDEQHLSSPCDMSVSPSDLCDYFFLLVADSDRKSRYIDILNEWQNAAISPRLRGNTMLQSTVHAECVMLLELRRLAPFDSGCYIGLSKPSCLACQHFLKAFNAVVFGSRQGFRTKGSYGKVCPVWGDPCALRWTEADEGSKVEIQRHFAEALRDDLKQALTAAAHSRMESELTTATDESDSDDELSKAIEEVEELLRLSRQEIQQAGMGHNL